jgi:hypothetical protein
MVHVKVNDGYLADIMVRQRMVRCHCHVVEDAVAATIAALCMVPRRPATHTCTC